MLIAYGPQNRIELFRAADVSTQTEPTADEKKRNRVTSVTTSKDDGGALRSEDRPAWRR